MRDLNDVFFYTEVVAHGGFAAAGRALRQPKSKLSRRVAQLEARLGVRLIERSTRRFRVTEVGQAFYERCRSAMIAMEQAEAAAADAQGEPRGVVRLSCPIGLMEYVSRILPEFMARYPLVKLQVIAVNRRVDLIDERIDVAIRVRTTLDTDAALTVQKIARNSRILVACPAFASGLNDTDDITALANTPTLSSTEQPGMDTWDLVGPEGRTYSLRHEPRLSCGDFIALSEAAAAGLGVALVPDHICHRAIRDGRLVRVFPDWHAQEGTVHLVFTARRGLPPAARVLIDMLSERLRVLLTS